MPFLHPHFAGNDLRRLLQKELAALISKALSRLPSPAPSALAVTSPPYLRGVVEGALMKLRIEANLSPFSGCHQIAVEGAVSRKAEHAVKILLCPTAPCDAVYPALFVRRGRFLFLREDQPLFKKLAKTFSPELARLLPHLSFKTRLERPYEHYANFLEYLESLDVKNKKLERLFAHCVQKLKI